MAGKAWGTFFDIEERLLRQGPEFSFFQAVRLIRLILRRLEKNGVKDAASIEGRFLRVRPELSLGFPAADIARITELSLDEHGEERRFLIDATFMGIYGISSPLPSFYTEDLLYEANEDKSVTRDFIDIINSVTYQLLIRTLLKYNIFIQIVEEHQPAYLEYLCLLAGLDEKTAKGLCPDELVLLRYGGIMNQAPHSALGLKTMLMDALGTNVDIEQCIPCMVTIPEENRTFLGLSNNALGENTHIGSEIEDSMQMFQIIIGPVTSERTGDFMPGGKFYRKADFLTSSYLDRPLDYEFRILIDVNSLKPVTPGDTECSALGINTWFAPPPGTRTLEASFSGGDSAGYTRGRPRRNLRCYE